jgi:hypothetical protein
MPATSSLPRILTRWLLLCSLLLAGSPFVHAVDPNDPAPPVVSLGKDTYKLTRGSKIFYQRSTSKLVQRARQDAEKYCHDMGRELKELSMEEIQGSLFFGDFPKAVITFKALPPGDPELASPAPAPVAGVPRDLDKLEDLHRSGVLNESEFDAAKRRLAERSLDDLHVRGVLTDAEYDAAKKRLSDHAK